MIISYYIEDALELMILMLEEERKVIVIIGLKYEIQMKKGVFGDMSLTVE